MFFDHKATKSLALKPYEPRPVAPLDLMTEQEIRSSSGQTFVIDLESYRNYFLIALKHVQTKKQIIFEQSPDTTFDPHQLSWTLNSFRTVGFNTIKFDLPLIWLAYKTRDINVLFEATQKLINDMRPYELCNEYGFRIHETNHIDLIEVAPLKGSLKTYAARLHAKRLQDLPFDPHIPLTYDQAMVVRDYCVYSDLDATILMFDNLQEQIKLREELSTQYDTNLMSKSDAQIAEAVISSELRKLSGKKLSKPALAEDYVHTYQAPTFIKFQTPLMQHVLETVRNAKYTLENGSPKVPKEISDLKVTIGSSTYRMGNGGLHSSESKITHRADEMMLLQDHDVSSFYPAIVLNNNFYPKHLGTNFLVVYRTLVERRLEAKKNKNTVVADSLKITINGSFGKLGSPHSILYSPDLLIQVTVTGQLSLLMLIEALELVGIPVVSANTDGIVIKFPKSMQDVAQATIKAWEAVTEFSTESTNYRSIFQRDCNNYVAIYE